jgi:anti-sigma regulatory factor (Ser/Thr protein kinase)
MRTGAAAGHRGHYHEAICYDSDENLLTVVVPFLLDGVAAGEPAIASLDDRHTALVRAALPADSGVEFLDGGATYAKPAAAIQAYRRLMTRHVAGGARQIRIVGEMTPRTAGTTWDWWARYESAINHAYDEFPLWGMCAYDTRITPTSVLADVERTHPWSVRPSGDHVRNDAYLDPETFLSDDRPLAPDPLEHTAPLADLLQPTPAAARQAVRDADRGQLPPDSVQDLIVAVSEMVTNAHKYGRAPVRMRLWSGADRIVVSISDQGPGPKDPFAGLLPTARNATGGLGLWITYQSCDHVALQRRPDRYTVRLTAGATVRP